jgi:hypothetical protein
VTENLWIRQVALVARELEPAVKSLRDALAIDITATPPLPISVCTTP